MLHLFKFSPKISKPLGNFSHRRLSARAPFPHPEAHRTKSQTARHRPLGTLHVLRHTAKKLRLDKPKSGRGIENLLRYLAQSPYQRPAAGQENPSRKTRPDRIGFARDMLH